MRIETVIRLLEKHKANVEKIDTRDKDVLSLCKALDSAVNVCKHYHYLHDIEKQLKGVEK